MASSDAELLEQWRNGDRKAGQALFRRYYETLERFFINKVPGDIADFVQETLRRCLEGRDRIADGSKFRSYLFSVAHNVLRNHFRNKVRHGIALDLDEVTVQELAPGPRSVLAERDEQRLLLQALRTIPVTDQVILELRYWEALTDPEIAEVLGVPLGTAKGRMNRARRRLETKLRALTSPPEH